MTLMQLRTIHTSYRYLHHITPVFKISGYAGMYIDSLAGLKFDRGPKVKSTISMEVSPQQVAFLRLFILF